MTTLQSVLIVWDKEKICYGDKAFRIWWLPQAGTVLCAEKTMHLKCVFCFFPQGLVKRMVMNIRDFLSRNEPKPSCTKSSSVSEPSVHHKSAGMITWAWSHILVQVGHPYQKFENVEFSKIQIFYFWVPTWLFAWKIKLQTVFHA